MTVNLCLNDKDFIMRLPRIALLALPLTLLAACGGGEFYAVELAYDPILAKALPSMQKNFPNAPVTETEAGHFLQEEVPVEIAAALVRVLDRAQRSKNGDTNGSVAETPPAS